MLKNFLNIFRSSDRNRNLEDLKTPPHNSTDLDKKEIYPFLHKPDWEGLSNDSLVWCFHYSKDEQPELYVSYVVKDESEIFAINTTAMDEDNYETVRSTGDYNIKKFTPELIPYSEVNSEIYYAEKSFFLSEKILDNSLLEETHKILNTDEYRISIPSKGSMYLISNSASEKALKDFMGLHQIYWTDSQVTGQNLCKDIFIIKEGKINGVLYINF